MGWFSSDVKGPIDAIGNAIDKVFTTDEERMKAQALLDKLRLQPEILNLEINKLTVQHKSRFIAGGRSFIIYVCGAGLLYAACIAPLLFQLFNWPMAPINESVLKDLLYAILGLGAYRTYEKNKGVHS